MKYKIPIVGQILSGYQKDLAHWRQMFLLTNVNQLQTVLTHGRGRAANNILGFFKFPTCFHLKLLTRLPEDVSK